MSDNSSSNIFRDFINTLDLDDFGAKESETIPPIMLPAHSESTKAVSSGHSCETVKEDFADAIENDSAADLDSFISQVKACPICRVIVLNKTSYIMRKLHE